MVDRLVAVDDGDYRLPDPVLAALAADAGDPVSQIGAAIDTRYGSTMYAPANGIVGDGVADDAPALQALLNKAATFGASVTLQGGSTLLLGSPITVPSGTRLFGNRALVKKKETLASSAFVISGVSNVLIGGLRVDGQRALFVSSEHQHGFYIVVGATNVTLRDVDVFDCNGDGIYIGHQGGASKDVTLEKVHSYGNNRQGLSVSHVSGFEAIHCTFESTLGTNPQAGVDIEPNADNVVCENLKFTSCTFRGNAHFGFLVSLRAAPTANQGGIDLVACTIEGNGDGSAFAGGLNLRAARRFTMTGGTIRNNNGPGVFIDWTAISRDVKFLGVNIVDNQRQGVLVSSGFDDLTMIGCIIEGNGVFNPGNYPGAIFAPTLASANLRISACSFDGSSQRYGLQTNASVSKVSLVGNVYGTSSIGARALADDAASRLDLDTIVKPVVTGSRGGNAALASLLTAQATRGLITDNTTA